MSGWTIFLLVLDLAVVAVATVASVRPAPTDDAGRTLRGVRLAQIGVTGALVALIALVAEPLGFGGVVGLVAMAIVAGEALRYALAFAELEKVLGVSGWGPSAMGGLALLFGGGVVVLVWLAAQTAAPSPESNGLPYEASLFGVPISDYQVIDGRALPGRPAVSDAGVAGGVAAPVDKYTVAGQEVMLEVSHDVTCSVAVVLLGPDEADGTPVLDVVVVYQPSPLSPTAAPDDTTGASRCAPSGPLAVHSLVQVTVPDGLPSSPVHDVGGDGAAKLVS